MTTDAARRPTALVAGCGDLGTEVALRLVARGEHVLGVRRRIEVLPREIDGLSVDLTQEVPALPDGDYRLLAVVLTADARDEEGYRQTYVGGLHRVLSALDTVGVTPERAVLVSSTGVYGDARGDIDEDTPTLPTRETGRVLLDAERLFHERLPHGSVLRLSGLYGPGRSRFITQATSGEVTDRWTNRIHRDDAAAAVVHLLTGPQAPAPVYIGTDHEPARSTDVAAFITAHRAAPRAAAPSAAGEGHSAGRGGSRHGRSGEVQEGGSPPPERRAFSNARLVSSGFAFTYPTYREGYRAVLDGEGRRHP